MKDEKSIMDYDKSIRKSLDELIAIQKTTAEEAKKWQEEHEKRQAAADKSMAELRQTIKETDDQIKKTSKILGNYGNNLGSIAEEYFFNSFEKGKTDFFGEKFDEIRRNVKRFDEDIVKKDEYDILLINGKSIGIIEIKSKAHINDIPSVINKAETFRNSFPKFQKHKIYLGLASMVFYDELEIECQKYGIAIIKQVGDTIIINEEKIKVY